MLNFGASKPRVKEGPRPPGPPGSAPVRINVCVGSVIHLYQVGRPCCQYILVGISVPYPHPAFHHKVLSGWKCVNSNSMRAIAFPT